MSKDNNEIAVQPRSEFGNNAARRARNAGLIPAIIYGKGQEPRAIYLNAGDWISLAQHHHHLIYLVDGDRKQAALVKEVQINHLKNYYVHVDFQAVDVHAKVHSTVSLHAIGDCIGAAHGGTLEQSIHELAVECTPADLVDEIKVNVADLDIGDHLLVKDIVMPSGMTALTEADAIVFHVARPMQEEEAAPAAAEATEPEAIKEKKKEDAE